MLFTGLTFACAADDSNINPYGTDGGLDSSTRDGTGTRPVGMDAGDPDRGGTQICYARIPPNGCGYVIMETGETVRFAVDGESTDCDFAEWFCHHSSPVYEMDDRIKSVLISYGYARLQMVDRTMIEQELAITLVKFYEENTDEKGHFDDLRLLIGEEECL
jgi:hypothetical protein